MTDEPHAPKASGAGPTGPDRGSVDGVGVGASDPIFSGEEPVDRTTKRSTLLFQFFLFPLLIVVVAVGIFLFFGAIGGSEKSPNAQLSDVMTGGENEQKQAMHQLAVSLATERRRVDENKIPLAKAFFVEPKFRERLLAAFEESFENRRGSDRQTALALSLAAVGDPAYAEPLARRLTPAVDASVRGAVVEALGALPPTAPAVQPALLRASKDVDDSVRNRAILVLSRYDDAESLDAVKSALSDASVDVQLTAASALAARGDPSVKDVVARLLDPAWVQSNLVDAKRGTSGGGDDGKRNARLIALSNGLRAAERLSTTGAAGELKGKVEALTHDGDADVRKRAREVLDRWGSP